MRSFVRRNHAAPHLCKGSDSKTILQVVLQVVLQSAGGTRRIPFSLGARFGKGEVRAEGQAMILKHSLFMLWERFSS